MEKVVRLFLFIFDICRYVILTFLNIIKFHFAVVFTFDKLNPNTIQRY